MGEDDQLLLEKVLRLANVSMSAPRAPGIGSRSSSIRQAEGGEQQRVGDDMAVADAVGTSVLVCTLLLGILAACVGIRQARSKYREYAMGKYSESIEADEEGEDAVQQEDLPVVVVSLYPTFPTFRGEEGGRAPAAAPPSSGDIPST